MRRYDDTVEVPDQPGRKEPGQFLWRGRIYVVRGVLSHWYERSAWWEGGRGRALMGETDYVSGVGAGGEHEVWRVEASAGRSGGSGVFDLCATAPASGGSPSWRLVRVVD